MTAIFVAMGGFLFLLCIGIFVGILSALFGVGGGILLVPLLIDLDYEPLNAVATSAMAVTFTAISANYYHVKNGGLPLKSMSIMAIPCLLLSHLGVVTASKISRETILVLFGLFLLTTMVLVELKHHVTFRNNQSVPHSFVAVITVGCIGGFLAGIFGIGGGVILVPLQMLFFREPLKSAIRTSLGVVMIASIFSVIGHGISGNVLIIDGIFLGIGGLVGAQIGSRLLPRLSEKIAHRMFIFLLALLSAYVFWQAYATG